MVHAASAKGKNRKDRKGKKKTVYEYSLRSLRDIFYYSEFGAQPDPSLRSG
jgi:hypothetical protein